MLNYVIRRLVLMVPTLFGITFVTFMVMGLSPGGVGGTLLNGEGAMKGQAAKAYAEYMDRRYGLKQPLLVQYAKWLEHISPVGREANPDGTAGRFRFLKAPDLGYSFSKGRPVLDLVGEALPITLLLHAITVPVTYAVALVSGIYAARRRGGVFDLTSGFSFLALWSVPTILAGVMMIGYLANRQYAPLWPNGSPLFPTGGLHDLLADQMPFLPHFIKAGWERGWLLDLCWHLALPVTCLTYTGFAVMSRLTRGAVLENIAAEYARTARAKGLGGNVVLFRHVFRNALIPLITASAGLIPGLLGGSIIVENIFSIHGMGRLMIEAIYARDRELILDEALIVGLLGLVSYLLADLLYVVADPRVTYD